MPTKHTVVQGETIYSISQANGFRDWRVVWDDPANATLKSQRPDPGVLNPGDELTIPDRSPKTVDCKTSANYKFTVKATRVFFSTVLKDPYGQPYTNSKYKLVVDGMTFQGTTDGTGKLSESVPTAAKEAQVTVYVTVRGSAGRTRQAEVVYPRIKLGVLDPIDTATGVQGRLAALGYHCPLDGDLTSEASRKAVSDFQRAHDINPTGDVDPSTRTAIKDAYDTR